MNIAFIHPNIPGGEGTGATHSATQIIEAIKNGGHDVTVYCLSEPNSDATKPPYELRQLDLRRGKQYNFVEELNRAINKKESELGTFDIVHSYLMRSIPAMGQLGGNTRTSTVVTLNAFGGICPRNDLRYMGNATCSGDGVVKCSVCSAHGSITRTRREQNSLFEDLTRGGYRIINRLRNYRKVRQGHTKLDGIAHFQALSPHVKERYGEFGFPTDRITVIPNIVDEHFEVPHQSNFTEPFKLLYVGTLRYRKGVDRLIEIARELHNCHNREFHLSIAGNGSMRPELEERIYQEELSSHITLLGHVPYEELPTTYAKHDVFLYPGRWDEPFGRVFLESMCAGTPVFATDVGSIKTIIGHCGRTVTYSNAIEFSAELDEVLDTDRLKSYSERTQVQLERYRPEKVVSEFVNLYESL